MKNKVLRKSSWPDSVRHLIYIGVVQVVCALFFILDIGNDLFHEIYGFGFVPHLGVELLVVIALVVGSVIAYFEIRKHLERLKGGEITRQFLSGAFSTIFYSRCEGWGLTPAEADVALLVLKGYEPTEIAEFRGTSTGTVRAQLSRIYSKSDSHSRGQFVSSFIDLLLDVPDAPQEASDGTEL